MRCPLDCPGCRRELRPAGAGALDQVGGPMPALHWEAPADCPREVVAVRPVPPTCRPVLARLL